MRGEMRGGGGEGKGRGWLFRALLFGLLFQALSGVVGGIGLVLDPSGVSMGIPLQWLRGSPFRSYLVPGVILFLVLGLYPLLVAGLLWKRHPLARVGALAVGLALVIWIAVEILVIGYHPDPPLQLIYGILGVALLSLSSWSLTKGVIPPP